MIYEKQDIDFLATLSNTHNYGLPEELTTDILRQTEIFHYLLASKLISKVMDGTEFNLDLSGLNLKLDEILNKLKE